MIKKPSFFSVGYESLFSGVEGGEYFLVANNVVILQSFDEFFKSGVFMIGLVGFHRRGAHVHVVSQQSYVFARHYVVLRKGVWVQIAL